MDSMKLPAPRDESTTHHTPAEYTDDDQDYSYNAEEDHEPDEDIGCGAVEEDDHPEVPEVPEDAEQLAEPVELREATRTEPIPTTEGPMQEDMFTILLKNIQSMNQDFNTNLKEVKKDLQANNEKMDAQHQSIQDMKSSLKEDLKITTQKLRKDLLDYTQQLETRLVNSIQTVNNNAEQLAEKMTQDNKKLREELQSITTELKSEVGELKTHIEIKGCTKTELTECEHRLQQQIEVTQQDVQKLQEEHSKTKTKLETRIEHHIERHMEDYHQDIKRDQNEFREKVDTTLEQQSGKIEEETPLHNTAKRTTEETKLKPNKQTKMTTVNKLTIEQNSLPNKYKITKLRLRRPLTQRTTQMQRYLEEAHREEGPTSTHYYYQLWQHTSTSNYKNETDDPEPNLKQHRRNTRMILETCSYHTEHNIEGPENEGGNQYYGIDGTTVTYYDAWTTTEDEDPNTRKNQLEGKGNNMQYQGPTTGPRGPEERRYPQGGG